MSWVGDCYPAIVVWFLRLHVTPGYPETKYQVIIPVIFFFAGLKNNKGKKRPCETYEKPASHSLWFLAMPRKHTKVRTQGCLG
jgi:hypothetical protein